MLRPELRFHEVTGLHSFVSVGGRLFCRPVEAIRGARRTIRPLWLKQMTVQFPVVGKITAQGQIETRIPTRNFEVKFLFEVLPSPQPSQLRADVISALFFEVNDVLTGG